MMSQKLGASALIHSSHIATVAVPATLWIFGSSSWIMSDMSSALIRLGRLMELQGITPSRVGAATGTVSKRKSKGATGGCGAAAAATEAGTPPEDFGARRQGGATVIRIGTDARFERVVHGGAWRRLGKARVVKVTPTSSDHLRRLVTEVGPIEITERIEEVVLEPEQRFVPRSELIPRDFHFA